MILAVDETESFLGVVAAGCHSAAPSGPVRVEELPPGFVGTLVRVSSKIVALSLQEIGRQSLAAISVEEGQGGGERRHRHTHLNGSPHGSTPGRLAAIDYAMEILVQQEVTERRIIVESGLNFAEK